MKQVTSKISNLSEMTVRARDFLSLSALQTIYNYGLPLLDLTVIEEEEEEEPLLIYTAQGSPFRCKKLSVINGSPERNNVLKL